MGTAVQARSTTFAFRALLPGGLSNRLGTPSLNGMSETDIGAPSARPIRGRTPRATDVGPRWAPCHGWRDLLARSRSEDVLAALIDGDPLGLRQLVGDRVRAAALFLDVDRVHLDALARVAIDAAGEADKLDRKWILARVEASIDQVRDECSHVPSHEDSGGDALYRSLGRPMGLPADALGAACAAFNALEFSDRIAFVALVLERRALDEAARACGSPVPEMLRRARRALDALLVPFP